MTKFDIGILTLACLAFLSTVILMAMKIDVSVLLPITTAIIGAVLGKKGDAIVGAFKK